MVHCSVVIPVYEGAPLTERCIHEIRSHPPLVDHEIIVVDDASPDGSAARLATLDDVTLVARQENGGFARACNDGAATASGQLLVFLNNDTLPQPGWLDALVDHFERHPRAGAVGSKLLYPDGSVQHAGVVIGQDGFPRHVYNGLPGDHDAVSRPRIFQAVTAACVLVERSVFQEMDGFDTAYRNGMEDVDLCLRMGLAGLEVHYCPSSVLIHLESVTRGRRTPEIRAGIELFQQRWRDSLVPDDLQVFQEDDLLRVHYDDAFPIGIEVAPELATILGDRAGPLEQCLRHRSRQATALLRDLVDLSVIVGGQFGDRGSVGAPIEPNASEFAVQRPVDDAQQAAARHEDVTRRIDEIALAIHRLQEELASTSPASLDHLPTAGLSYRSMVDSIRRCVVDAVPPGGTVLVVSRGDGALVDVPGRVAWHFPRAADGGYAGHYPADAEEAIEHLEELRRAGASHFVLPADCVWWLEHYPGLSTHLDEHFPRPLEDDACTIFSLAPQRAHVAVG